MAAEPHIKRPPLHRFQLMIVVLCALLNALDGYDIFIMGFAMPYFPDDFASNSMQGYLISAALAGMGIGSVAFAPLADRYGRRLVLVAGLTLNAVGLTISALAPSYWVLLCSRLITGIAVGTIATVVVVLAPEVVPRAWRSFAVGTVMCGYPLGSTVAGFAGAALLAAVGGSWQGMFWVGLVLCIIALIATVAFMPESTAFLISKGDPESLRKAAVTQSRLGLEDDAPIRQADEDEVRKRPATVRLLGRELRTLTLLLWTTYTALSASFYFISSWTPKLITDATSDKAEGALAGLMISFGTLAGAALYATVGHRVSPPRYVVVGSAVAVVGLIGFASTLNGGFALMMAAVMGITVYGAMAATATSTLVYPVLVRTRGMGTMIGVARVGAIIAPILAGYALSFISIRSLYFSVIVLLVLALLAAVSLLSLSRKTTQSSEVQSLQTSR